MSIPSLFCWTDYVALNKDLPPTMTEAEAAAHWSEKGSAQVRLCNRKQLVVVSEYGPELILWASYYYYLFKTGLLFDNVIKTYKGMRPYYYFLPDAQVVEREGNRTWLGAEHRPLLLNRTEHVHRFDTRCWTPPPYRAAYTNSLFSFEKPLLIIHNKHNAEWESPVPINTLSVGLLDDLCRKLTPSYTVVYSRPSLGLAGYSYDHNPLIETTVDKDMLRSSHPSVLLYEDLLLRFPTYSYNHFKLLLHASCENYICVQGGNAHMVSFFFQRMVLLHKRGSELKSGAYSGWYNDTRPAEGKVLRIAVSEEQFGTDVGEVFWC
jgi:hypothetical protein